MKKSELTKEMRWYIADRMAEERLKTVNANNKIVIPKKSFYVKYGKRVLDICLSGIILIITLPINIIIGIITYFDVGSPIFFNQKRLGQNGKEFYIVKFRNMKNIFDDRGELLPASQRITKFGNFMRKTSLDELLNFWSILKGDMSIIGPRPLVPEYETRYSVRHKMRMAVKPGLECPPYKDLEHIWSWEEQFENDIWYVENISFFTDCYLIWRLIKFTFNKENSNARSKALRGPFTGYSDDGKALSLDEVPQYLIDKYINEWS